MKTKYCSFDELPLMLNADDVARALGVSRAFAYNLFNNVAFPAISIGKRKMVAKERFIEWLNEPERMVSHG